MRTSAPTHLLEQAETFALAFVCEQCVYFRHDDERCAHGYPTAPHRRMTFEHAPDRAMFCKEFELV